MSDSEYDVVDFTIDEDSINALREIAKNRLRAMAVSECSMSRFTDCANTYDELKVVIGDVFLNEIIVDSLIELIDKRSREYCEFFAVY